MLPDDYACDPLSSRSSEPLLFGPARPLSKKKKKNSALRHCFTVRVLIYHEFKKAVAEAPLNDRSVPLRCPRLALSEQGEHRARGSPNGNWDEQNAEKRCKRLDVEEHWLKAETQYYMGRPHRHSCGTKKHAQDSPIDDADFVKRFFFLSLRKLRGGYSDNTSFAALLSRSVEVVFAYFNYYLFQQLEAQFKSEKV